MSDPKPLLDLFAIEDLWTSEQRMARDAVRRFSREVCLPKFQGAFRDEVFPDELIPGLGELGVLGANLKGYGCAGMDEVAYGLVMREV